MLGVTVSVDFTKLMCVIPILTFLWILIRFRRDIWDCRKGIAFAVLLTMNGIIVGPPAAVYMKKLRAQNVPVEEFDWRATYLPGKWANLYKDLKCCKFSEAKLVAMEQFASHDAKFEPSLPSQGFDAICRLLEGHPEPALKIQRASVALKQFVAASPICERNPKVLEKGD